jgi:hypothetical protein
VTSRQGINNLERANGSIGRTAEVASNCPFIFVSPEGCVVNEPIIDAHDGQRLDIRSCMRYERQQAQSCDRRSREPATGDRGQAIRLALLTPSI